MHSLTLERVQAPRYGGVIPLIVGNVAHMGTRTCTSRNLKLVSEGQWLVGYTYMLQPLLLLFP